MRQLVQAKPARSPEVLFECVQESPLMPRIAVIGEADRVQLSARDSLLVFDLLENPPAPNVRLLAAAQALLKRAAARICEDR
jgi:hypothetical protein